MLDVSHTINEKKGERAERIESAKRMLDTAAAANRGLLASEQRSYDRIEAEIESLSTEISKLEAQDTREREQILRDIHAHDGDTRNDEFGRLFTQEVRRAWNGRETRTGLVGLSGAGDSFTDVAYWTATALDFLAATSVGMASGFVRV